MSFLFCGSEWKDGVGCKRDLRHMISFFLVVRPISSFLLGGIEGLERVVSSDLSYVSIVSRCAGFGAVELHFVLGCCYIARSWSSRFRIHFLAKSCSSKF